MRARKDTGGPSWDGVQLVGTVFRAVGGSGPWEVAEAEAVARALHHGLEADELAHLPRLIAEMVRQQVERVERNGAGAGAPPFSELGLMLDATIWAARGTFPEGRLFVM